MTIPRTKIELLDAMETEHRLLAESIAARPESEVSIPGVCHDWAVNDVVAHLACADLNWRRMIDLARELPEEELFRKCPYPWTRTRPLARYIAANTSSHYRWVRTRIRKWAKARESLGFSRLR